MDNTITLSIEPLGEKAFVHGFHLGTIESLARSMAEEMFHGRNRWGLPTVSVALIRNGEIIGCYDGEW